MPAVLGAPSNPFSTRFHAPGAIPFRFQKERGAASAGECFERFAAHGYCSEIHGPHGTGKTTLLHELEREARARGFEVLRVTLHADQRRMPNGWSEPNGASGTRRTILFLDGAEQLARARRWLVRRRCRDLGWGLLATTHGTLGLPVLYCSGVDAEFAERLVAGLLAQCPGQPRLVRPDEARAALAEAQGNLREAIFRLYDLYEERWRQRTVQVE